MSSLREHFQRGLTEGGVANTIPWARIPDGVKRTESKLSTSIPRSASWSAEVKANRIQLCHPAAASCRAFPPRWTTSLILWAEINPSSIKLFLSGVGHRDVVQSWFTPARRVLPIFQP